MKQKKRGREREEGGGRGRESRRDCHVISLHPPAYQLPWQQYPTNLVAPPGWPLWLEGGEREGKEEEYNILYSDSELALQIRVSSCMTLCYHGN